MEARPPRARLPRGPVVVVLALLLAPVVVWGWQPWRHIPARAGVAYQPRPAQAAPPARPRQARPVARPAGPRLAGELIAVNIGSPQQSNRVFEAKGQAGIHPRLAARPGERVRVVLANYDIHEHSFTIDQVTSTDVAPGRTATVTFTVPGTPGSYRYHCRLGKPGMDGVLLVQR